MPTPEPADHSAAIQEMVEIAVQADIRRSAIIFAAIDASAQTVREDIAAAQRANGQMFTAIREVQAEHTRILGEHTRILGELKTDVGELKTGMAEVLEILRTRS